MKSLRNLFKKGKRTSTGENQTEMEETSEDLDECLAIANAKDFKFGLGDEVRDVVTGFKGVVICRSQWLNNCNTYSVKPRELQLGLPQDTKHFDEPQLKLLKKNVFRPERKTGGPERSVQAPNR